MSSSSPQGAGGGGGGALTNRAVDDTDSPVTLADGERLLVDASNGAVTVNLPAPASDFRGEVKATDASNTITLSRNGGENIDGSASDVTITATNVAVSLTSDGTDWWIT